jgi:integrase
VRACWRASLGWVVAGYNRAGTPDPEAAGAEAKKLLSQVGLAVDPAVEKATRRADASLTFGSLLDGYLKLQQGRLRPSTYRETERYLRTVWVPLHGLPISKITRGAIAARLAALEGSAPVAASRARAALSAFFSWAMRRGHADANPVINSYRPERVATRDRVLTDGELVEIWRGCRDDDFGRIVKLLILTGQRREEVGAMAWQELDIAKAQWSLDGARTKNKLPHLVPLSEAALSVLSGVEVRVGRDLLLGDGDGPFSGWSRAKANLDGRLQKAREEAAPDLKPMPLWRLHDLRRTTATRLADLGVQPHVVEAVLNHISGARAGVAGIYNRAAYTKEKTAALALLGEHVTHLVQARRAPSL